MLTQCEGICRCLLSGYLLSVRVGLLSVWVVLTHAVYGGAYSGAYMQRVGECILGMVNIAHELLPP